MNDLVLVSTNQVKDDKIIEEQDIDKSNSYNITLTLESNKPLNAYNSKNGDCENQPNIQQNLNFNNPLGLFEEESFDETPSQKIKRDKEDEMFFVFEDESQEATNGNDSKNIDTDYSKADISESSNQETPSSGICLKGIMSWRGRRKFRGSKVPLSVINRKYKKKVGEAIANKEKEEKKNEFQLFEYYWPPGKSAELCMIQEAVSEYLSIVSFRRKYPDLTRRPIDVKEREFLKEQFLVTDFQCDLGLTVLLADEVYDLMEEDFSQLYQDYLKKPRRRYRYIEKPVDPVLAEKLRKEQILRRAIESASSYNSNLLKERMNERKNYLDLQTFTIHCNRKWQKVGVNPYENLTNYFPASLVPGQFQEFYKKYTQNELNYLPINTALYTTHKKLTTHPDDYQDSDQEEPPLHGGAITLDNIQSESIQDLAILQNNEVILPLIKDDSDDIKNIKEENDKIEKRETAEGIDVRRDDDAINQVEGSVDVSGEADDDEEGAVKESTPKKRKLFLKRKSFVKSCSFCGQFALNKKNVPDDLIRCSTCKLHNHPGCLELSSRMIPSLRKYAWQCMDCKICCQCKEPHDEDKMMFCDMCDRGYHTYCVGLETIPEGQWECSTCANPDQPAKPKRGRPCKPRPLISTAPPNELINDSNDSLIVNASQSEITSSLHEDQMDDQIKTKELKEFSLQVDQPQDNSFQIDQSQNSSAQISQSEEASPKINSPEIESVNMDQAQDFIKSE